MREASDFDSVVVPHLHYTVSDATASLTRLRVRSGGPFFLERPRDPLRIERWDGSLESGRVAVSVTCATWLGTVLLLPLRRDPSTHHDWVAWGDFTIHYAGPAHHPSLVNLVLNTKRIAPSWENSTKGLPMRYQVRNRVR